MLVKRSLQALLAGAMCIGLIPCLAGCSNDADKKPTAADAKSFAGADPSKMTPEQRKVTADALRSHGHDPSAFEDKK